MQIVYTGQPIVPHDLSIFLAGPSPRDKETKSWRPEALKILSLFKFQGVVYVPEYGDNPPTTGPYTFQCEWEWEALHTVKKIVFWIPRDLNVLPAFTTNIKFGFYVSSGKVVYGRPIGSPKNDYLDWLYEKVTGNKPVTSLEGVLHQACFSNASK